MIWGGGPADGAGTVRHGPTDRAQCSLGVAMDVDVEVAGLGAFRVPVDPSIGCVASKPFIPRVQYSQFVESFGQVRHLGDGFDGPISVRSCGHPGSIQEALPDRAQFWPTAGHQDDGSGPCGSQVVHLVLRVFKGEKPEPQASAERTTI